MQAREVGFLEAHLKLQLAVDGETANALSAQPAASTADVIDARATRASRRTSLTAMLFRHAEPLPSRIRAVFGLEVNEWNDTRTLQLTIEYWEPA